MRAIRFHGYNDARVEDVPRPDPTGDEALIETRRVQLSVTECNLYRGEKIVHYEQIKRQLDAGPTRMLGHEFCGVVAEVGDDVTDLAVGDRVYAPGKITCGDCPYCDSGRENYCPNKINIGYETPGGLAEYFTLPEGPLCKLPDGVSDAEGAAMQPFASSVICAEDGDVTTGDVVAVVGTGVMGYQCAQLARLSGAGTVFAIDVDPEKLALAEERGLIPVDAREEDPVAVVHDATDGVGADVAFEAVGGHQEHGNEGGDPLAQAMRMVRRGGAVVQVGHIIDEISFTPRALRATSVDWVHPTPATVSLGPNTDSGELAARLVADGRVSIDDYVTHELDGLESFEELVDITLDKSEYGALGPAQIVV